MKNRHDGFVSYTELPLLVLALVDCPILVWEALAWGGRSGSPPVWAELISYIVWALFAGDLIIRLWLTEEPKLKYLNRNWVDVFIVLLPFLRVLRILRIVRLLQAVLYLVRALRTVRRFTRRGFVKRTLVVISLSITSATFVAWLAERSHSDSDIRTFWDALWWTMCTITTVGYGDLYPVTAVGRSVAMVLMLVGIVTFGVLTANIAAYLMSQRHPTNCPNCGSALTRMSEPIHSLHQ